jgi:Right handed beta helix region
MKHSMLSVLAISLFTLLHIDPAAAQFARTWVSGLGNDVNPCTRTQPCQTFAAALSKVAPGGEINCLDSGGFGTVEITKSISIRCVGVTAGITGVGNFGISVNTPAGSEVLLEGLDIEGNANATPVGIDGVRIISAAKVTIKNCSIRNFFGAGVNLQGPAGARVLIEDSMILSNNNGLIIAGTGGASNVGILVRTTVDNHPGTSIVVVPGSILYMSGSKLLGSATNVSGGGSFVSFGDNALQGTGTPTTTIPLR